MGANTAIEWCHATFNHIRGCTKVSDGCKFCYAETLSKRYPGTLGTWGPKGERVVASENYWKQPVKWNRDAEQAGERRRVFCASLADVFEGEDSIPVTSWRAVKEARWRLFGLIQNTPWLDWLLLTKRPQNVMRILKAMPLATGNPGGPSLADIMPFPNVWIGTSVEDQATADERIPHLVKIPARVRFLSCEPLLAPVDIEKWLYEDPRLAPKILGIDGKIDWVITGGESGPHARPSHPDWFRSLREQCAAAEVPFLFKQWGEFEYIPHAEAFQHPMSGTTKERQVSLSHAYGYRDHRAHYRVVPENGLYSAFRVGKKAAGRLLDGVEHNGYPEVTL